MQNLISQLLQDARFALRQLRRAPFFSLTVLATLALAIGATSAITGVLRATLLNALPYPHPAQLVEIADHNIRGFKDAGMTGVLRTADLAALPTFKSVGFYYSDDSTLTLPNQEPVRVPAVGVSGTYFSTIGTAPLLGRTLTPADDVTHAPEVIVLSYRLWQTTFAADPKVIGRVVRIGTEQGTVVGVMPEAFALPAAVDMWHPGHVSPDNFGGYRGDGSRFVTVIARLAVGQTLASAQASAAALAGRLATQYPGSDASWSFTVTDLRTALFGNFRNALLLLAAAVALVLLTAALNIAGLQVSRNALRAPEFALRGALGISRARLVRQLLTESLLLVLSGAVLGLLLAPALLRVLNARLPTAFTTVEKPHVDLAVIALSLSLALLVGIATALVPALLSTRLLAAGNRSITVRSRAGRTFTVVQIALALVLLTVSASVLRGLYKLTSAPLGYTPDNLQTFTIDLPWNVDPAKSQAIYLEAARQFAALPGVESVGSAQALPLSPFNARRTFDVAGQPPTPNHDAVVANGSNILPGFLATLRIPLLGGRDITAHDTDPGVPGVVLVNQALATRYFSSRNPIGQHLTSTDLIAGKPVAQQYEIIGLVPDLRGTGGPLSQPPQPQIYFAGSGGWPHMQFALRTSQPASSLAPQVRRIVSSLSPLASPGHFSTLAFTLNRTLAQPRLNASLLTAFAALSLLLVILGVYGLVAFEITQRTRELGLRLALGSSRAGIRNLVLEGSLRILAIGLALGLAGSLLATRLLTALIADNHSASPLLFAMTTAVVALAVLCATLIPARRAAHLDPIATLRAN